MSRRTPRIPHVPALDGLRGLAVAAVLLYHTGHLSGGFLGVDLFFTLSGFLITSLLIAEWGADRRVDFKEFWSRRARRLLPALFVVLAAVTVFAAGFAGVDQLARIRADTLWSLVYLQNWHMIAADRGYWEIFVSPSPLEHLWSLSIEEQFYVLYPLVFLGIFGVSRGRSWVLAAAAAVGAVASGIWMAVLYTPGDDPSRVYFGTDTRAFSILTGVCAAAVVAVWRRRHETRPPLTTGPRVQVMRALGWVLFAGLLWSWWRADFLESSWLYQGGMFLHSVTAAVLIVIAVHPAAGLLGRALSVRAVTFLGLLSYGLYLWHWPIIVWLTPDRTGLDGWPLTIVQLGLSLLVALASFHLVEQPIRRGKLSHKAWTPALIPVAMVLIAVGSIAATTTTPVEREQAQQAATSPILAQAGEKSAPPTDPPPTSVPVGDRKLMVVGDSVALTVGAGMERVGPAEQVTVLNRGFLGCGISRGDGQVRLRNDAVVTEHPDCPKWPERWAADLASFRPDGVLVVLGAWDLADRKVGGDWQHPCEADFDPWWSGEITQALEVLRSTGVPVTVATVPYLRSDVLGVSESEGDARAGCLNALIRQAAQATGADVVELASWVCPTAATCVKEVDGTVLRPDGVHYDGAGGDVVARWLLPQVAFRPPGTGGAGPTSTALAGTPTAGPGTAPTSTAPTSTTPASTTPASTAPTSTAVGGSMAPATEAPPAGGDEVLGAEAVRQAGLPAPSPERPLRVTLVGDSQMYDAAPAVAAALEATGVVHVAHEYARGFGLDGVYPWRSEWPRIIRDEDPDLVVGMWGGWDVGKHRDDPEGYRALLGEAVDMLTAGGAKVLLLGFPASMEDWFHPRPIDRSLTIDVQGLVDRYPGTVAYVDADLAVAPDGVAVRDLVSATGVVERVRKKDLAHFCPDGAKRIAVLTVASIQQLTALPAPAAGWDTGPWRGDGRYDDPKGTCS